MKYLTRPILLAVSFLLILTCCGRKYYEEEINAFLENIDAFQHVNALIIDYVTANDIAAETIVVGYDEDGAVARLYPYTDSLSTDDIASLTTIKELLHGDFDFIRCYGGRISYAGDGSRVYVYMENDQPPSFFWYPDDGLRFETYKICDNWYLLYHYFGR